MTIGWIYEGDQDRWYETVGHGEHQIQTGPVLCTCAICEKQFPDSDALSRHFSLEHPIERPILLIDNHEPLHSELIASPIRPNAVAALGCTEIRLSVDGQPDVLVSPDTLAKELATQRCAHARVELINRRAVDGASTETRYELSIRVPDSTNLRKIDDGFVRHLANDSLNMGSIRRFCEEFEDIYGEMDYINGLVSYAKAVLTKDHTPESGITLPFAAYADHLRQSIRVLSLYSTPLAKLLTRVIRLNLNEFAMSERRTGAPALDRTYEIFSRLAYGVDLEGISKLERRSPTIPACPTDSVTERIIALTGRWPQLAEPDLRYLDGACLSSSIAMVDRVKTAALRGAYDHLQGQTTRPAVLVILQNDPVFSAVVTADADHQ